MAGIYIHIPYCKQACSYCNFHFSVSKRNRQPFIDALLKEMELQKYFFEDSAEGRQKAVIDTVYFGGGTPSTLSTRELGRIIEKLDDVFGLDHISEFTLEANPDDISTEKLLSLKHAGVNRLSIGIQSFHKEDLEYMNRMHSPQQAGESITIARQAGFQNLTVDLIYGTPGMHDAMWHKNMAKIFDFGVSHISAYALTLEPKTPLEYYIRKGKAPAISDEQTARQFKQMLEVMRAKGYVHYEISNFALPGHFSKHNLAYWQGVPYLGLGPSAHSYKNNRRFWNVSNTTKYINELQQANMPQNSELLTPEQSLNEYVMTSLRTLWGCNLSLVKGKWGNNAAEMLERKATGFIRDGLMQKAENSLVLSDAGKLFADGIAADLFSV